MSADGREVTGPLGDIDESLETSPRRRTQLHSSSDTQTNRGRAQVAGSLGKRQESDVQGDEPASEAGVPGTAGHRLGLVGAGVGFLVTCGLPMSLGPQPSGQPSCVHAFLCPPELPDLSPLPRRHTDVFV